MQEQQLCRPEIVGKELQQLEESRLLQLTCPQPQWLRLGLTRMPQRYALQGRMGIARPKQLFTLFSCWQSTLISGGLLGLQTVNYFSRLELRGNCSDVIAVL
jgi:hypothetical protein